MLCTPLICSAMVDLRRTLHRRTAPQVKKSTASLHSQERQAPCQQENRGRLRDRRVVHQLDGIDVGSFVIEIRSLHWTMRIRRASLTPTSAKSNPNCMATFVPFGAPE